ncbi:hypothetical protein [Bowmanella denitrificans]|uniref:hypothetical protein n=1 Tax=Bowmanella denitrificans TaxID=366582 RepID=UPI0011AF3A24|nr:hypothetical protein [Bowmanella denitrificans]
MTINTENSVNRALQCTGAVASMGMALCYIFMFIVFGALLSFPASESIADKIQYIAEQQLLISLAYLVGYLVFGGLLLISVQALHNKMQLANSGLLNTASLFGIVWVVLMMASGMIALVAMNTMVSLFNKSPLQAETLFYTYNTIVNGQGGGIELVGGLWVLLASICGLVHKIMSKGLHMLGVVVGTFGVLTLIQSIPEIKELFGLSQIVWFIWLALSLRPGR